MSLSVFSLSLSIVLRKKSSTKSTKPTKVQILQALLRDLIVVIFLCWRKIRETLSFTN